MAIRASDLARLGPAAQRQILAKLQADGKKPDAGTKYKNKKTPVVMPNGQTRMFDSIREASRYRELMLMLREGRIRNLRLQVEYTIQPAYITAEGNRVAAIRYKADFVYERPVTMSHEPSWEEVVEDAKGVRTDTYKMKKKLMLERFGITIQEV